MRDITNGEFYTERLKDGRIAWFRGPRPTNPPAKYPRGPQARWDREHLATFSTHVDKETAERFRRACDSMDETPYQCLRQFIQSVARNASPPSRGGS